MPDTVLAILGLLNTLMFGALLTEWRNRWKDAKLLEDATAKTTQMINAVSNDIQNFNIQLKHLTDKVNAHELKIGLSK